jgi:transcriptional regulator with XRE-family HTH domain
MINIKLKQARLAANLTQEELAEKIGVSRQTISNWENGRSYPDIVSIIFLSDIYDMTLDSLLKGDNEMIKHLKKSTDVTKSNQQVVIGLAIFGAIVVIGFLIRDFVPAFPMGGLIINITASVGLVAAAIAVITRSIDRINRTTFKIPNKTLLKTGVIVLTVLLYGLFVFSLWSD